ncbi:MAG: SCO family protein [Gammaproteobacteria bacterium]
MDLRYTRAMEQSPPPIPRFLLFVALALVALIAFSAGVYLARSDRTGGPGPDVPGLLWPDPVVLGDFALDDARGGRFDTRRLRDRWTLMFFGFTHCPDVCPTTLATLASVRTRLADLPAFAQRGQVVFVSVDAARDTPEALRAYVDYFDPTIEAATAEPERLDLLTRQLGILYARMDTGDAAEYSFDHTASVLLIGPRQEFLGVFAPPHAPGELASRVRAIINFMETR